MHTRQNVCFPMKRVMRCKVIHSIPDSVVSWPTQIFFISHIYNNVKMQQWRESHANTISRPINLIYLQLIWFSNWFFSVYRTNYWISSKYCILDHIQVIIFDEFRKSILHLTVPPGFGYFVFSSTMVKTKWYFMLSFWNMDHFQSKWSHSFCC